MEPDERLERIRQARAGYDRARARLFREIRDGLAAGEALPEDQRRKLGIKPGNGTPANEAHRETMAIVMTAMREAQDPRASAPVAGEEQDR